MSDVPWFKAKRYGWGWGAANTWQGWLAYAIFFALVGVLAWEFPPMRDPGAFTVGLLGLSAALTIVCLRKGERPRWRWGR